jgi:dTDP-4-amino-4,6-dideoxygalactose transaminase
MVHYLPVPLHPYYRDRFGYKRGDFPHAEELYAREVSMPLFYGLSDEDVASVVDAVLAVIS